MTESSQKVIASSPAASAPSRGTSHRQDSASRMPATRQAAMRFTPSGGVVSIGARIETNSRVQICVSDQGPGVPVDFVPRLFEKFAQADSSATRKKGGTGLGLAIARAIAEKHGGELSYIAPQNPSQGATFAFTLPLALEEILGESANENCWQEPAPSPGGVSW